MKEENLVTTNMRRATVNGAHVDFLKRMNKRKHRKKKDKYCNFFPQTVNQQKFMQKERHFRPIHQIFPICGKSFLIKASDL